MTSNMGTFDRVIRFAIAIVVAALWFSGGITGALAIVAVIVAVAFFVTSLIGWCPLYTVFGWSTRKRATHEAG